MSDKVTVNAEGIELFTAVKWEPLDNVAAAGILSGVNIKKSAIYEDDLYMLCFEHPAGPIGYAQGNICFVVKISAKGNAMDISRAVIPELMTEALVNWCNRQGQEGNAVPG